MLKAVVYSFDFQRFAIKCNSPYDAAEHNSEAQVVGKSFHGLHPEADSHIRHFLDGGEHRTLCDSPLAAVIDAAAKTSHIFTATEKIHPVADVLLPYIIVGAHVRGSYGLPFSRFKFHVAQRVLDIVPEIVGLNVRPAVFCKEVKVFLPQYIARLGVSGRFSLLRGIVLLGLYVVEDTRTAADKAQGSEQEQGGPQSHNFGQESGTGATTDISVCLTGCSKRISCACRQIPPSGLERGAPYLRSPLMGQPRCES